MIPVAKVTRRRAPTASAFLGDLRTSYYWDSYGTTAADFDTIENKPAYAVGDKIARFTLFAQNGSEIVTGGDDKHLDFQVSVRKLGGPGATHVALSTVVSPHNALGRANLCAILPFHRAGVRAILANALAAGRI
jgi:hypothetical protein